jgi:mannitol-1-phosphate 5-dehydrogenase
MKKLVLFGAGKIGRSFIGQLFSRSGFEVVFVDVQEKVIQELNRKKAYSVVIKSDQPDEILEIKNVRGILAFDEAAVISELTDCDLVAVSVGQKALIHVVPLIAKGLLQRIKSATAKPMDIILAENMRNADVFVRELLEKELGNSFPVDSFVGLIETSIGKMVPIMPDELIQNDPLLVFAEPYNTLIVDRVAFRNPVPEVAGLAPKTNIKAWVDRKAFIHNLGHATAAYYGYYLHPKAIYLFEVLDDVNVLNFTRNVMLQSADILLKTYPKDFTKFDLEAHINDLIHRFRNKALQDTIFRVGQDLTRKLGSQDRFMGSVHLAQICRMPYDLILKAMSYGFCFTAKDETGNSTPSDKAFLEIVSNDFENSLVQLLGFNRLIDRNIINELEKQHKLISPKSML